ncbi:MAG: class I SAM-dependent methyltransferase, partial [Gaiellaceae bacterium]
GELVVDIGSRDAAHAIRLVRDHGLRAIALDPVPLHAELARRALADAGLEDEVEVVEAGIEAMPLPDSVADWIWCRDVLGHVDQVRGFAECARILRSGGRMLAYVTLATKLLEPREAEDLFKALAIVPESMDPVGVERRAAAAKLMLVSSTPLGGEWRERMIEDGTWDAGNDLLRLSRLHRREAELVERHGAVRVTAFAAGKLWGVYQLLGKLCPTIYVWERGA